MRKWRDGGWWGKDVIDHLGDVLNRGRRCGVIDWRSISDDGVTQMFPKGFGSADRFWARVREDAVRFRRDRLAGQPFEIEVWVETAGLVQQVFNAVANYGVGVSSSGGMDGTTPKFKAARRFVVLPTLVFHVGDFDPAGMTVFDVLAKDVAALTADMARGRGLPDVVRCEFVRLALTHEQVVEHGLPVIPFTDKQLANRAKWPGDFDWDAVGGTVQLEALDPAALGSVLQAAVEERMDMGVYRELLEEEDRERDGIVWRVIDAIEAIEDDDDDDEDEGDDGE